MKNKRTVILFTDEINAESAQSVRDHLAGDKENLPIIIGEDEFQSVAARLIKDRLFNEDGFVMRSYEKLKSRYISKKMDKVPPQDIAFKNQSASYRKAYNILVRYNPDLIILNGPCIMREVLAARAKALPDAKVVMLVTGYILNRQLINKHIDRYFIDNIAIKTTLVNEGIPEDKITLADFPICPRFDREFIKEEIYNEYKFTEGKPTVLIAVPPADNSEIRGAIDCLEARKSDFNIIADCGKDREILVYARDRGIKAINEGRESSPLYAIADIVISRPSPMIMAKTFYKEKLFFALNPKSEEEKRTAEYLKDIIVKAENDRLLNASLDKYLNEKSAFDTIREGIKEHNAKRPRGLLYSSIDVLLKFADKP